MGADQQVGGVDKRRALGAVGGEAGANRLLHAVEIVLPLEEGPEHHPVARGVGRHGDGTAEVLLGCDELATPHIPAAKGVVTSSVAGVAAESFLPVEFGRTCGMAVLLQVEAVEEELFEGGYFRRKRWLWPAT